MSAKWDAAAPRLDGFRAEVRALMLTPLHLAAKIARMESEDIARMVRTEPARSAVVAARVLVKACETAEAPPKNQSSSRLDDFRGEVRALFVAAQSARMEPEDITRMVRTDPARCAAEIVRFLAEVRATAEAPPKNRLRKTGGMTELREMTPPSGIFLGDTFRARHGKDKAARISEKKLAFLDLAGKSLGVNPFQPLDECFAVGLAGSSTKSWRWAEEYKSARPVRTGGDDPALRGPFGRESGRRPFFNATNANAYSGICRVVVSDPTRISPVGGKGSSARRRPTEVILATPPPMDDLLRRADDTAQWSCSPNTERTYNSALREFAKFAAAQGRPAFPADPHVIAAFLQHRIDLGLSPTSLSATLAALKHAHNEANQPDPTAAPKIRAITRGHRRRLAAQGKRSKQTRGLSESNLAAIVAVARANSGGDIITLRDIAIISLLREGLLRCGECAALRVRDFSRKEDGNGRLFISRSKTDQEGQGQTLFLGEKATAVVTDWLTAAPADGGAPLFRWIRRSGHVQSSGLTNKSINLIIKSRGEAAGIFGLSGHSGRVGMAQDLVAFGASIAEVALAGRWETPGMVLHYASRQEAGRGAVAKYRQNRE